MLQPMRRGVGFLSLLLCLITVLLLAFPVTAADTSAENVRHAAVVYYKPSIHSEVIGCMEMGRELTVLEERGDFYKIDCYDMTGYIPKTSVLAIQGKYFVSYSRFESQRRDVMQLSFDKSIPLTSQLYSTAIQQVGVRYRLGGTSPKGFDCSGFTQYVYGQNGIELGRTCEAQLSQGVIIAKENLRPGDLVFFHRTNHPTALVTHVGMYLGDGKLIHAGSGGITIVDLDHRYFAQHYLCARRIVLTEDITVELPAAAAPAAARSAIPRQVPSRSLLP